MKLFVTGIVTIATLLLAQGCSSLPKAEEKPVSVATQHEGHSMGGMEHDGHSMNDPDNGKQSAIAQAKLTAPTNITANTPVPLIIDIQDSAGKVIKSFETFQEKQMHLIAVSDDLQFFSHLHPTHKENGRFEIEAQFPQPGAYTLFSDYKPAQATEQVSVLKTQVSGKSPTSPEINLDRTKTFGDTKVNLTVSSTPVKAGEEVNLRFDLQDASNNQPLADLQPYLGERGHLVILKQSSPLTQADYIHAHAAKNTPAGQVDFMTSFPQPGKYKLWGQFNRKGKIVTADFWLNVL